MRVLSFAWLLVSITACAPGGSQYQIGKTTRSQIEAQKGAPLQEEKQSLPSTVVTIYPEDEKFQYKDDILRARFRRPEGQEKHLIYWKHQFKDCTTSTQKLIDTVDVHNKSKIQLTCQESGLSVIYSEGAPFIERVVHHE